MKKIAKVDQDKIVLLLQRWPSSLTLTWEGLRNKLARISDMQLKDVWSRQSLSANQEIYVAYAAAKRRPEQVTVSGNSSDISNQKHRIDKLEFALNELQARYDKLLLRHAQLAYNASLLEGGSHLLDDPLPDNTKSQRGR